MHEYTPDYLLNKRIKIFQPVDGYRASTDAVILSSLIQGLKNGESILDIGSGTGAISLCLAERFKNQKINITGVELQPTLAELSNLSAEANSFEEFLHYINADIKTKIKELEPCSFNRVISNPPYTDHDMPSPNDSKALAHNHHDFSLDGWIKFCIKMLKPQGWFYMINRAEAVDEILSSIYGKLGNIMIIPLYSKQGQTAKRVMIIARKDSRAPSSIHQGLIVHRDNGEYTTASYNILREGLDFFEAIKLAGKD